MLMLSSIAFLQLSLENRAADLLIGFIQASLEGSTVSVRYLSTLASSTLSNFFCLNFKYRILDGKKRKKIVLKLYQDLKLNQRADRAGVTDLYLSDTYTGSSGLSSDLSKLLSLEV